MKGNLKKFLIVGHEGSHNRGCEALVRTCIKVIRSQYPNSYVTVASEYPEHEHPLLDIDNVDIVPAVSTLQGVLPEIKEEIGFKKVKHLKKIILSADAVISVGGDVFIDDWGPPTLAMETMEYVQFLGKRNIIWGHSFSPFRSSTIEDRVRRLLLKCDLILVRDEISINYLASIGVKKGVFLTADGAFLMEPSDHSIQVNWGQTPSMIIGINGSIMDVLDTKRRSYFLSSLVGFIKKLIDDYQSGIVLVPHDGYPAVRERDFLFELKQLIDRPDLTYMPPVALGAQATKKLIARCDFFISMRLHPSIAAMSQAIPTLAMSYSPKFSGLHQMLFGHTDYVVSYDDVSLESLISIFNKIQRKKDDIRSHLGNRLVELQTMAENNGVYLKELLLS